MTEKDYIFINDNDQASLGKIRQSVELFSRLVGSTMGPSGRPVLIQSEYGDPRATKDGVTVAKKIESSHGLESVVFGVLRSAATQTVSEAGDGTTTSTVLAAAIYQEASRLILAGYNERGVCEGIDLAVNHLIHHLKKSAAAVTNQDLAKVAAISANNDAAIGDLVSAAILEVGTEGVVTVEESRTCDTSYDVVKGMQFDRGFISSYFSTNAEKSECVFENPYILLHEKKISSVQSLIPILEAVSKQSRALLIIAEDVEAEALMTLVVNRVRSGLKVCAVKSPAFGDRRKAILDDIAAVTGAVVISDELDMKLENVKLHQLGQASRITVSHNTTTVVAADNDASVHAVQARCHQIRSQMLETTSDYDREKLQERLAKLVGGVAVIRVGAYNEIQAKELKDRVEDGVHATRAAQRGGILPGGGVAFVHAAAGLKELIAKTDEDARKEGISVVQKAILAPIKTILVNAGRSADVVIQNINASSDPLYGYDALHHRYGNMMELGIIDPALVVTSALRYAAEAAKLLLTRSFITHQPKKNEATPSPQAGGGMDF